MHEKIDRPERLTVKLTVEEKELLVKAAKNTGQTLSKLCRSTLIEKAQKLIK